MCVQSSFITHSLTLSLTLSLSLPVESCSSDTIRNAVKILQDLEVLVPVRNGDSNISLTVANSDHLVEIIRELSLLRGS